MKKVLIATTNLGKVEEFRALFASVPIELVTLCDLDVNIEVVEDGTTYQQNAGKKAQAYARESGLITLSDDSGLEVDALDGAPGIYSARFSVKENATDADRRAYLLSKLADKPQPWTARFHATIAIAYPDNTLLFRDGVCEGEIIREERGVNGFGYDPIFYIPTLKKTMAELTMEEKNQLSHRALAAKKTLGLF